MKSQNSQTPKTAFKLALEYLFRTRDFGTFLAFLFLWKRRKEFPIEEKKEKVSGFIYPH
ncbi:MAG: hypothetical protein QF886_08060 [Planctomycetota bacterium]|nr:hypothetical protein [Planctomycetota bacterium]